MLVVWVCRPVFFEARPRKISRLIGVMTKHPGKSSALADFTSSCLDRSSQLNHQLIYTIDQDGK